MTPKNTQTFMETSNHQPASTGKGLFAVILGCFFVSGMTGLVYEILWTRLTIKIIGTAPFAVSIILTVFMGGLGLGGYLSGKTIHRIKHPNHLIIAYGICELIIAAYGLLLPTLLNLFRPLYAFLYNHLFGNFLFFNFLTFSGCFLLMLIPVICMGATLPILSRFSVASLSHMGSRVGRLYGINTLGAAGGTFLCGFVLIDRLGVDHTMWLAVIGNTLIGLVSILMGIYALPQRMVPESKLSTNSIAENDRAEGELFPRQALLIAAVSGFATMAYEVIWTKLLSVIVGPTTYSFTIVLTTFITGLALGSMYFGRLADRLKAHTLPMALLLTQTAAALAALVVSQGLGSSQIFFAKLIYYFQGRFALLLLLKTCLLFVFMVIPTFFLGAAFPLVSRIYTRSVPETGRTVGMAYAVNSLGGVLGAFSAGFMLIPFLGKEQSLSLVVALQLLSALIAGGNLLWRLKPAKFLWAAMLTPVLVGIILVTSYPSWNRDMLAGGKYHRYRKFEEQSIGWLESLFSGMDRFQKFETEKLVFYGDGIGGFTTVWQAGPDVIGRTDYTMINSGKADATTNRVDMCTQTVSAHFPMIFHAGAKSVLVVGLGSGITAGEVLHYPIDSLDIVEISDQVVDASRFFIPWNNQVLADPKTRMIIQDGRAHLELSQRTYDVIISEPSNPWMGGMAALFTAEYMQLAKDRLNDSGIYVQWFHSYQMNWQYFALVGRTFASVFPHSLLVSTSPGTLGPDFLFIGFKNPLKIDHAKAARNVDFAKQSQNTTIRNHRLLFNLIVHEDLKTLFGSGPINTDDRPYLEFAAPKLMHISVDDSQVANILASKPGLSASSQQVLQNYWSDTGNQVDYAAFMLSFREYDPNRINFQSLTAGQREDLAQALEKYGSQNIIRDFTFVGDELLRQRLVAACLAKAMKNTVDSENQADHYYYIGFLNYQSNHPLEAVEYFFKALAIKPGDMDMNKTLKQALAGLPREEALEILRQRMSRNPGNVSYYYQLGAVNEQAGNMAEAIADYEKARSLRPDFIPALSSLAHIRMNQKEYSQAVALFQRIIEIRPDFNSAHYNIACIYAIQHRQAEALAWLAEALRQGFNNWPHLLADTDLAGIRNTREFKALLANYSTADQKQDPPVIPQ